MNLFKLWLTKFCETRLRKCKTVTFIPSCVVSTQTFQIKNNCHSAYRRVDKNLVAHNDILGYYQVPDMKGDTIVSTIEDALRRFNLPLSNLKVQTYHGASNMMVHKSEVAEQIKNTSQKA